MKAIHHQTYEWMTVEAFREAVSFVHTLCVPERPFEIIISGQSPRDQEEAGEKVRPFEQAGAIWWVEVGYGFTLEDSAIAFAVDRHGSPECPCPVIRIIVHARATILCRMRQTPCKPDTLLTVGSTFADTTPHWDLYTHKVEQWYSGAWENRNRWRRGKYGKNTGYRINLANGSEMKLRLHPTKNNQEKNIRWAKNYEI